MSKVRAMSGMRDMRTVCLAAALLALGFTAGAQENTAVIDGIVIDDAGSPVPSAGVSLVSDAGHVLKTMTADDSGVFVFDALTQGRFTIAAAKIGYADRSYGQPSAGALPVVIALAANGRFTARVRLPRAGAISGTVVDEDGQPVSVTVRAMRFTLRNGLRTLEDRAVSTDADRLGRYRFPDLPPGEYVISAMGPDGALRRMTPNMIQRALQAVQQPAQSPLPPDDDESTVSYVPVYYPGVVSRARATPVALGPGEDRANIDLQLQVLPAIRLEGTVLKEDGKPAAYAMAALAGADDGQTWAYGQTTSAGYFHLAPVPLGAYVLSVGGTRVDVALGDPLVAKITVHLTSATGSVTGRVVFDGAAPRPDCRRTSCRPMLIARAAQAGAAVTTGNIAGVMDAAGPIAFSGVAPGQYSLALVNPIAGWTMDSAMLDGREMMDVPVDIGPRQNVSGLVVTFTDRQTELAGSTPVGGMAAPADAVSIVIFPADRRLWAPGARRVRVARPDTAGQYRVAGLPPGDYLVAVVTNFDAEAELDAARLGAIEAGAARVTVRRPDPR